MGERELWRGQPAWLGYISLSVAVIASAAAPALTLVDRPGPGRVAALGALVLASVLIARVVYRGWQRTGDRYVLTTAALYYSALALRRRERRARTIPLAAVDRVDLDQAWWQRFVGVGNVTLHLFGSADMPGPTLRLRDIPEPEELVRRIRHRLLLLSADAGTWEADARELFDRIVARPHTHTGAGDTRNAKPQAAERHPTMRVLAGPLIGIAVVCGLLAMGIGSQDERQVRADPRRDPIYRPDGTRRPQSEIVAFMEAEVMPFARHALGPVVGGAEYVACETCHGEDPEARGYRMPAVSVLPHTFHVGQTTLRQALTDDVQMHNAVVGTASDYGNAATAEYMQRVVLPGMAALLNRPVYDRSRPYEYNRTRSAFGCYHCHRLKQDDEPAVPVK